MLGDLVRFSLRAKEPSLAATERGLRSWQPRFVRFERTVIPYYRRYPLLDDDLAAENGGDGR